MTDSGLFMIITSQNLWFYLFLKITKSAFKFKDESNEEVEASIHKRAEREIESVKLLYRQSCFIQ